MYFISNLCPDDKEVLDYLAAAYTTEKIIEEFSDLTREQIAACRDYARDLADFEIVV